MGNRWSLKVKYGSLLSKTTSLETKFESFLSSLEEPDWMIELGNQLYSFKETSFPDSKQNPGKNRNLSNFHFENFLSTNRKICSFSINTDQISPVNEFASVDSFSKVYIELI